MKKKKKKKKQHNWHAPKLLDRLKCESEMKAMEE